MAKRVRLHLWLLKTRTLYLSSCVCVRTWKWFLHLTWKECSRETKQTNRGGVEVVPVCRWDLIRKQETHSLSSHKRRLDSNSHFQLLHPAERERETVELLNVSSVHALKIRTLLPACPCYELTKRFLLHDKWAQALQTLSWTLTSNFSTEPTHTNLRLAY